MCLTPCSSFEHYRRPFRRNFRRPSPAALLSQRSTIAGTLVDSDPPLQGGKWGWPPASSAQRSNLCSFPHWPGLRIDVPPQARSRVVTRADRLAIRGTALDGVKF